MILYTKSKLKLTILTNTVMIYKVYYQKSLEIGWLGIR